MRLLIPLALVGCPNPISNEQFLADQEFVAALPGSSRMELGLPFSQLQVGNDLFLENAAEATSRFDQLTKVPSRIVDALGTPNERSIIHRTWDARTMVAPDGSSTETWRIRANITRTDEEGDFVWSIEAANEEEDDWFEIGFGRHDPDGSGTFLWDFAVQDRLLDTTYGVRLDTSYTQVDDQREVEVIVPVPRGLPQVYVLVGESIFGWSGDLSMTGELLPGAAQMYVQSDGSGRAIGVLQREEEELNFSACWSATGDTLFASGSVPSLPQTGTEEDCPVQDVLSAN